MLAVIFLWRSLQKALSDKDRQLSEKDAHITSMIETATTALVTSSAAQAELRKIVEASTRAKEELKDAIKDLTRVVEGCPSRNKVHE